MKKKKCITADYISNLPDPLIHHIYSFMDMKSVVQTTILSTRWNHLWKSTPTLNFHLDYTTLKQNPRYFKYFVDQVFRLREACKITKLSLSSLQEIKTADISTWLYAAKTRNVEEVHLFSIFYRDDHLELREDLFTSVHKLSLQRRPLPSWACSSKLMTSLKLVSVRFPDGDSNGHLNFSCPVLENLVMTFCGITHLKMLTVSTPLLNNLELNTAITCKINICCPNLTSFECSSFVRQPLSLEETLSFLVTADIDMFPYDDTVAAISSYHNCSRNVLERICNVQSLTLRDSFLKTMIMDHQDLLEMVPNMFHKLRYMLVKDWDCGVSTHALANILNILPCIETLVWRRNQQGSTSQSKEKTQVVDFSCESILRSLKTFEIRNLQADTDELMFVKFLLTRAMVLKKMIFLITSTDFAESSKVKDFKEKVLALPRASTTLSVSFILRG